eukprot:m.9306 g.9306  ORF g.9306 m.9306 type:complete len:444 (-) comp5390_c1_seq1:282-1613(-)
MALARRTRSMARSAAPELSDFNFAELGVTPIHWPKENTQAAKRARKEEEPAMRFSSITPPTTDTTAFAFFDAEKKAEHETEEQVERLMRGRVESSEEVTFLARNRRTTPSVAGLNMFDVCSDDLVVKIFSFLPERHLATVARVCHRFASLMLDLSLWPAIEIRDRSLTTPAFHTALKCNPISFRAISCSVIPLQEPPRLSSPSSTLRLTHLSLAYSSLSEEDLIFLFQAAPGLVSLDLSGMVLSNRTLRTLAQHCTNLEELCLRMTRNLDNEAVCDLLFHCTRLRVVNLSWTEVDQEVLQVVALTLPCLRQLDLSGLGEVITDQHVHDIVRSHPGLEVVDFSDCYNLTDASLDSMLFNSPRLARVAMSRCHNITMAALLRLISKPSLQCVNMFGCIADVRSVILRTFPHVEFNRVALSQVGSFLELGAAPDGLTEAQRRLRGI